MRYITLGDTFDVKFTTRRFSSGAPFALAGTPVVSAYPDNSTTQLTAGITLTVDFDGVTGLNNVRVVASSGNSYAAGNWALVITTGTVDSVSVVGEVIENFVIGAVPSDLRQMGGVAQSATDLKDFADDGYDPSTNKVQGVVLTDTVTTYTGNTPQTGDAYARLGAPVGASISADVAAVKGDTVDIEADTQDIQSRLPAALVSGRMDSNMQAAANDVITAAVIATGAIDADAIAPNAIGASELAADAVAEIQSGLSTLDAAGVRSAVGLASADLDTQLAALPTAGENADAVWDEALAGHLGAGSTGAALNASGSAGDPWASALPGAYGAGTAGFIVGTNLDALVSNVEADTQNIQSRLPAALVGGRMDSNMQAAANGVVTAAVIATGAIDADALAADAMDEFWDEVMEGTTTARQSMRLANSANGGKVAGAATTNVTIRDLADSKNRVDATVDADGNRSAVTLDLT
jgi:hypothetical protein